MKLDEFVKRSLLDITKGVVGASEEACVTISPASIEGKPIFEPQMVSFELVVAESSAAGGGISVLSIGNAKAGMRSEQINKLSFSVPVHFNTRNAQKREFEK